MLSRSSIASPALDRIAVPDGFLVPRQRPLVPVVSHALARRAAGECVGTSYPSPHSARRQGRARSQLGSTHSSSGLQAPALSSRQQRQQYAADASYGGDASIPELLDDADLPSMRDLQDILPALSPKQLADAIWAFAKSEAQPSRECLDIIAAEVHSKFTAFRCQDLSNTIWAFAVLKYYPSRQWWDDFERQVYAKLDTFGDRELANLMWSLAVLEHRPAMLLETLLAHAASDNFAGYRANSLHLVVWSIGKLSFQPSEEWLDAFLGAAQRNFFQLTPSEMSNIFWALAKLGHKLPAMWVDNFLMVAQWRFPSFSAKLMSILAWSAAMMDHRPSHEWLLCFEQQVREKFTEFTGQELACVAWALRKFGCSAEGNAVFYMLERQEHFVGADFDILGNPKLLRQVLSWQQQAGDLSGLDPTVTRSPLL